MQEEFQQGLQLYPSLSRFPSDRRFVVRGLRHEGALAIPEMRLAMDSGRVISVDELIQSSDPHSLVITVKPASPKSSWEYVQSCVGERECSPVLVDKRDHIMYPTGELHLIVDQRIGRKRRDEIGDKYGLGYWGQPYRGLFFCRPTKIAYLPEIAHALLDEEDIHSVDLVCEMSVTRC